MKNKIKYIIISLIIVLCCFIYAHVYKPHNIYDSSTDTSAYLALDLQNGEAISQTFRCSEKELTGFSVKVAVNSISDQKKLFYRLMNEAGEDLIEGSISFSTIESGRINEIHFDKAIEINSKEEYTIQFRSSELQDEEHVQLYCDPVGVRSGKLEDAETPMDGTLILKTLTYRFDIETFVVTLGVAVYLVAFFRILYKLFS
ncbi:hypothetical protein [Lachnoclostridium sp. An118]|uniref:hypothetical protein n=1 Tax=Lachnoclostridium sp. An118 TaxID=1965547 RepID=UPI00117B407A|nr:hypothetical protein [Lachnoclostridium sp. An118]